MVASAAPVPLFGGGSSSDAHSHTGLGRCDGRRARVVERCRRIRGAAEVRRSLRCGGRRADVPDPGHRPGLLAQYQLPRRLPRLHSPCSTTSSRPATASSTWPRCPARVTCPTNSTRRPRSTTRRCRPAAPSRVVFKTFQDVGGAHPQTFYKSFNWDQGLRKPITIDNLFREGHPTVSRDPAAGAERAGEAVRSTGGDRARGRSRPDEVRRTSPSPTTRSSSSSARANSCRKRRARCRCRSRVGRSTR